MPVYDVRVCLNENPVTSRPTIIGGQGLDLSVKRSLKSNPNPAQIELKTNRLHDQIIAKDFLYRPSLIGGDNCNSSVVHYICTKRSGGGGGGESRKRVNKYFAQDWRAR